MYKAKHLPWIMNIQWQRTPEEKYYIGVGYTLQKLLFNIHQFCLSIFFVVAGIKFSICAYTWE